MRVVGAKRSRAAGVQTRPGAAGVGTGRKGQRMQMVSSQLETLPLGEGSRCHVLTYNLAFKRTARCLLNYIAFDFGKSANGDNTQTQSQGDVPAVACCTLLSLGILTVAVVFKGLASRLWDTSGQKRQQEASGYVSAACAVVGERSVPILRAVQ